MNDPTPLTLLERIRRDPSDNLSWQRFLDLYTGWLQGWVWRLARLPQGADADEVLQNVFVVVFQRLPQFVHNGRPGAFRAWLKMVLVNCLRDYQKKRRAGGDDPGPVLDQFEDPHSELSHKWDEEHNSHLVDKLCTRAQQRFTPYYWEAFRRTTFDGKSTRAVAEEMGVSDNAVLLARSRVLAWMRQEGAELLD